MLQVHVLPGGLRQEEARAIKGAVDGHEACGETKGQKRQRTKARRPTRSDEVCEQKCNVDRRACRGGAGRKGEIQGSTRRTAPRQWREARTRCSDVKTTGKAKRDAARTDAVCNLCLTCVHTGDTRERARERERERERDEPRRKTSRFFLPSPLAFLPPQRTPERAPRRESVHDKNARRNAVSAQRREKGDRTKNERVQRSRDQRRTAAPLFLPHFAFPSAPLPPFALSLTVEEAAAVRTLRAAEEREAQTSGTRAREQREKRKEPQSCGIRRCVFVGGPCRWTYRGPPCAACRATAAPRARAARAAPRARCG